MAVAPEPTIEDVSQQTKISIRTLFRLLHNLKSTGSAIITKSVETRGRKKKFGEEEQQVSHSLLSLLALEMLNPLIVSCRTS